MTPLNEARLLRYNLWTVETGLLLFALLAFDWKVMVLLFLSLWWTKLNTKLGQS